MEKTIKVIFSFDNFNGALNVVDKHIKTQKKINRRNAVFGLVVTAYIVGLVNQSYKQAKEIEELRREMKERKV